MLFGNRNELGLEIDPLAPSWDRRAPDDRGPWAQFQLWVRGQNLAENIYPGTDSVSASISIPLAPIANWLVRNAAYIAHEESPRAFPTSENLPEALEQWKKATHGPRYSEDAWDDERYAWEERHFLRAADPGAWLPNVAFVRVGNDLWVSWASPRFATRQSPRFINSSGVHAIPWMEAESAFSRFVDAVAEELATLELESEYPWARQQHPFNASLPLSWDTYLEFIAPVVGADVFQLFNAHDVPSLLSALELPPEAGPEDSVAALAFRDLNGHAPIGDVLRQCEKDSRRQSSRDLGEFRDMLRQGFGSGSPEQQGYETATALRDLLELGSAPLNGFRDRIESELGIVIRDAGVQAADDNCVAGAHLGGSGVVMILDSPRTERNWARRMEGLRGLGHVLLDAHSRSGAIGAGSSTRASGPRRRRSGAFAAEMLVPRAAMMQHTGAQLDAGAEPAVFEQMMEDYGAGARTTAWQLYNAGLLSSRDIVDELIEHYGSHDSHHAE
jgi:hypothetical protein